MNLTDSVLLDAVERTKAKLEELVKKWRESFIIDYVRNEFESFVIDIERKQEFVKDGFRRFWRTVSFTWTVDYDPATGLVVEVRVGWEHVDVVAFFEDKGDEVAWERLGLDVASVLWQVNEHITEED